MGDINGDLKTDVAYFAQTGGELYVYGFGAAGTWVHKGTGNVANSTGAYPYVTMGDYDGDSIAVQFQASELLFANPHPVVVIASDPYWADIQTGGSTSFGTTSTTAESRDKNVGFSVGVTFGYEAEGIFDIYKASLKTSFESSFDWTATQSVEIDESYSYSTSDEDLVIFTVVPYDVYYYKVIQAPDPKMVGTTITVNLPRTPITLPVERGFYNDHNGSAPDIDSSVLTHTIGNPLSYPNQEQAKSLIAYNGGEGLMSSNMLSVGEGSGNTSIEMSKSQQTGTGVSFDLSVTIEAEAGAGGFTVGTSAGFHYGESYSVSTGNGTVFSGQVVNIPEANFSTDKSFNWGLFTYRGKLGRDEFIVVQYYTGSNQ